jgi:hypothetical protein
VDDALLVGGGEAGRDLDGVVHGLAHGQRGVSEQLPERLSFQELEHDVGAAVVAARVEDRDQVRVVEGARGSGFLLEAADAVGVARHLRPKNLDRHLAAEPLVPRPVHLAHPAGAERGQHLVRPETCARPESPGFGRTVGGIQDHASPYSSATPW